MSFKSIKVKGIQKAEDLPQVICLQGVTSNEHCQAKRWKKTEFGDIAKSLNQPNEINSTSELPVRIK